MAFRPQSRPHSPHESGSGWWKPAPPETKLGPCGGRQWRGLPHRLSGLGHFFQNLNIHSLVCPTTKLRERQASAPFCRWKPWGSEPCSRSHDQLLAESRALGSSPGSASSCCLGIMKMTMSVSSLFSGHPLVRSTSTICNHGMSALSALPLQPTLTVLNCAGWALRQSSAAASWAQPIWRGALGACGEGPWWYPEVFTNKGVHRVPEGLVGGRSHELTGLSRSWIAGEEENDLESPEFSSYLTAGTPLTLLAGGF